MADEQNQYYRDYFKDDGVYTMQSTAGSSRVLQLQDWIKAHVPKGGKILDVGCGDMFLATQLTDYEWTGIDVCTDKAQGTAINHDLMVAPYPFKADSFDCVLTSEVVEHVWDMRIVHKEAHRLLKRGGKYIVSTPNFNWIENVLTRYQLIVFNPERPWTMEHIRHYTPECHQKHLNDAGFKVVEITGADAHFGEFFRHASAVLAERLVGLGHKEYEQVGPVHQLLGKMFPLNSHTVMFLTEVV